jgi:ubiquinone biosynthesis protein
MNHANNLSRYAEIARFLMKYRTAGIFKSAELDPTLVSDESAVPVEIPEGKPEEFVDDLEALGPTFIKIGQTLSTRPDLVPPEYIVALERMQDDVEQVPYEQIREIVESELGVRMSKAFEFFDETPLAAASLGQVHRAALRDGRPVAVKIQRPDIAAQISKDLDILTKLAGGVDRMTEAGKRYRFVDWVSELRKTLTAELDYRLEASNLKRFGENLKGYEKLFVPRPIDDYCSARMLTMDMVKGTKITEDRAHFARMERDLSGLAQELMRAYLDQVFVHGLIHADPHPGNLLLMDDGRLALLDLGMVAHVPPKMRDRLLKLMLAAVDGRGEDVAAVCETLGTRLQDYKEVDFVRECGRLISQYNAYERTTDLSEGRLMLELTRLGGLYGLRPPPEMTLLGKTLLNLELVSTTLDPDLDVKNVVHRHLHEMMQKRMVQAMSPSSLASEMLEMHELAREMPRRAYALLRTLSDNRFRVHITGLEESHLIENLQKIANRISTGVIAAALIIGAAMMMRVDTANKLFGYPAIALIMFVLAFALGAALVFSALMADRKPKDREDQEPG